MSWIEDLTKINEVTKDLNNPLPLKEKIAIIQAIACKDVPKNAEAIYLANWICKYLKNIDYLGHFSYGIPISECEFKIGTEGYPNGANTVYNINKPLWDYPHAISLAILDYIKHNQLPF